MMNGALQAQQGLRPSALRSIGARANGLQQRPAARPAARRLPRVTMAAAEADVVEEQPAVPEAAAPVASEDAPARFPRRDGPRNDRRRPQKPRYGPDRTMQVTDLEVGKTYEGAVVSVTDFGAFINLGCATDGLLHISQISVEFVRNVSDAVEIGQPISVRVLSVDTDRKKFAVSAIPEGEEPPRRGERNNRWDDEDAGGDSGGRQEPPRQARAQKQRRAPRTPCPVAAGDVVTGPISSVAPFGIFIDLGDGHTGMLHSSQMKLPEGVQDHMRHYNVGDSVEVRVSSIGRGGDKVALTQKSDAEIAAEEETRTRGLAAVSDLPEGSGPMAYIMARAGVKSGDFEAVGKAKAAPVEAAVPVEEVPAPVEEVPAPVGEVPAPVEAAAAPVAEEETAAPAAAAAKEEKAAPAPAAGISAGVVKTLREASGAGMMDCKKALIECNGDLETAKEYLRKKGLASADKKSSRVASEGAIGSYIHAGSRLGVLVEVNCETDFVARGEKFRELVSDMAMQIAACPDVRFVSASDVPAEVLEKERAIEMEKEDLKSKPEAIREKIVQGRVDKIAKEFALLEQPFIKDTNKTVAEHIKSQVAAIGENMQVRRFGRFVLGEGLEKKEVDFAAEVAAQTGGKI